MAPPIFAWKISTLSSPAPATCRLADKNPKPDFLSRVLSRGSHDLRPSLDWFHSSRIRTQQTAYFYHFQKQARQRKPSFILSSTAKAHAITAAWRPRTGRRFSGSRNDDNDDDDDDDNEYVGYGSRRREESSRPARDAPVTFGNWYRDAKQAGRPAPLLGSLKPKSLQWMVRQLADTEMDEWAERAAEVLKDPIYVDRQEWTEFNRLRENVGVEAALQFADKCNWVPLSDIIAWGGVKPDFIGTSLSIRIPRKTKDMISKEKALNSKDGFDYLSFSSDGKLVTSRKSPTDVSPMTSGRQVIVSTATTPKPRATARRDGVRSGGLSASKALALRRKRFENRMESEWETEDEIEGTRGRKSEGKDGAIGLSKLQLLKEMKKQKEKREKQWQEGDDNSDM